MTVVGIDVGAQQKGFHAVAMRRRKVVALTQQLDADRMAEWCQEMSPKIIAVDAPSGWSSTGRSRLAERTLAVDDEIVQCFKTPMREHAQRQDTGFYDWVFNGEALYASLIGDSCRLFDNETHSAAIVIETFPHAVVCALAGKVVRARPKGAVRRAALRAAGSDPDCLPNIDFVDAALCAVAAESFLDGRGRSFGNSEEGFIVIPLVAAQGEKHESRMLNGAP